MKRTAACLTFIFCALLVGVFPNANAARISSITLCEQVNDDATIPINVTSRFKADASSIHAIVGIENADVGSTIRGVWVSVDAIEVPNYEIDGAEAIAAAGDAVVHFALSRPDNGWPLGNYKLDVYMDGKFAVSAPFAVADDGGRERAAASAAPSTARAPMDKNTAKKDPAAALLGTWQCRMPEGTTMTLVFESTSRLNFEGYPAAYTVVGSALRVTDEDGTLDYPYTLKGNVLTIDDPDGYQLQFTKASDKTDYAGESYSSQADRESGVYDEGAGGYAPQGDVVPDQGGSVQPQAGGDVDLMGHFAGTWWNATTNTETNVTLTPDGRYFESSTASYSGGSSDQYGDTDMTWGTAGDQQAQGTWTVRGTREQGVLTIFFQNGNQREINYRVHVENGEVYWKEYFFNGELYGKK